MPLAALMLALFALSTPALATEPLLPEPLREVGIDQRLNESVPLQLEFRDETGRLVRLGDYFGKRPVVLAPVYYECPMLCTMVLNGLLRTLRAVTLDAGRHFEVIAVSFDPREGPALAAAKKAEYVRQYGRTGASEGWHFLTGTPESVDALMRSIGFRYRYDSEKDQFAHASSIMVLTPKGKLARYLYGVDYPARDLRLSIVEASAGRIGSAVDQVLLFCFHYDPSTGKYSLLVMNVLRVAGLLTLAAIGALLFVLMRKDRQQKATRHVDRLSPIS